MIQRPATRCSTVLVLVLVAGMQASTSKAADAAPAPIPVEAFYRNANISEAQLSPSGQRLAVNTGAGAKRVGLAVFDLQNTANSKVIARFNDADIRDFQWVNDDYLVFRVIDLATGGGFQRIAPGLFSVKADGSELRQLIKLNREWVVAYKTIRHEPLTPDHELMGVPEGGGNEVIVGRVVVNGSGDAIAIYPMLLDVTTQRTRSLSADAPDHAIGWIFDPKGEPRVVLARHEGQSRFYWRAPGQNGWKEIAKFDSLKMAFVPRFVDATGQLFVTTDQGPAGYGVLKRFDFATMKPEPEPFVDTPGFDVRGHLITSDDTSGRPLGVRLVTDAETTVWFDERMKKVQQAVDARFPGHVNRVACRKCSSDDMTVLVVSWSDQDPGQYWVFRPSTNAWQSLGRTRPDIDPKHMATLSLHRIAARDGLELPVWVTLPTGADEKMARPAIVLVHGGPWVRGVYWGWERDAQFLASRGYVVIEPEYRGSTGYGYKHFRAGWKQFGQAMQDDVADALNWAVSQGWVDAKKVCIAGASYGGYAVLMGLIRNPELYRCGVAWVALTDPRLLYESSWVSDMSDEVRIYQLPVLIGDPKSDAAALAAVTPVEQAARIKAPLLLAFGALDTRVPLEHGTRMRAALRAAGQEPEWVVYVDEGHGWLKEEDRFDFARRMETFLAKYLK